MINRKVFVNYDTGEAEYSLKKEILDVKLGPNDVLVKINSCGLSETNVKILKLFFKEDENHCYPVGRDISGVVESVGSEVTFKAGDEVTGVLPVNSPYSGCGMLCVLSDYDLVIKPENVSHVDAACAIGDAVKAYTGLFYQTRVTTGETVVIVGASKVFGILATQLAQYWGAKVIVAGSTDEEIVFLKSLNPPADQVIDLRNKRKEIVSVCLEETGGLGVDCFIDDGVEMYSDEFNDSLKGNSGKELLPSKHDIISCLAVGGRWITSQSDLQLDPPDSQLLHLKCASVHYLFVHSWTLSRNAQGRYSHILNDIMNKMATAILRPTVHHTVLLDDCIESFYHVTNIGKVVVKL